LNSPVRKRRSTPLAGIEDGVLTVKCESTAWATQLRMMRVDIMTHISVRYPDAGIQSIRFQGPNAPPGKRVPDQSQGAVRAIPTARETNLVTLE
jgi:predicted nucleic acid-binding Zn ribbon protein